WITSWLLLCSSAVGFVIYRTGLRAHSAIPLPVCGLNGCQDGSGNGLTKTSFITHLRDRHCSGEAQAITKQSILSDLVVYERVELTFKRMGLWLCGFVLYDLTKPSVPSCSEQLDLVGDEVRDLHSGFTLGVLDSLFLKGLRTVKSILPKCRLGFSRALKGALDKGMPGGSLQLLRETLAESSPTLSDVNDEDIELGERNIKQCKRKIYVSP
ncbi:hypothetical protein Tco_1435798, partial [Tanacetum coccineum]